MPLYYITGISGSGKSTVLSELKHRGYDWGKNPHELEFSLKVNHELEERYKKFGYGAIDASQTTDTIVDEILRVAHVA